MTTTTEHAARVRETFFASEAPAWINVDAIFPPEPNLRDRVFDVVMEGSRLVEQLHDFVTRAVKLNDEVGVYAWPEGRADDFDDISLPLIGADALVRLLDALTGVAGEGTECVPAHDFYLECLGSFGLEPIRERDETGRRTDLPRPSSTGHAPRCDPTETVDR